MVLAAVDLVLDAVVREMHLAIEVRQVVLARPVADLVVAAVWSSVDVCAVSVVVLQELLVLALEILLEDDAADLEIRMLVSEAGFLLAERRVRPRGGSRRDPGRCTRADRSIERQAWALLANSSRRLGCP